jgi:hypothetical protein
MPIEVAAIDQLTQRAHMPPELAVAIAKSIDLSITGAKMDVRFASLEKSIASAKVWAISLYATLTITFFGALAADHHWLVNREDQLIERLEARDGQHSEQLDHRFEQIARHFEQVDQHLQRLDQITERFRTR